MKDSIEREAAAMGLTLVPRENTERPYNKAWAVCRGETVLMVLAGTMSVAAFLWGYAAARGLEE